MQAKTTMFGRKLCSAIFICCLSSIMRLSYASCLAVHGWFIRVKIWRLCSLLSNVNLFEINGLIFSSVYTPSDLRLRIELNFVIKLCGLLTCCTNIRAEAITQSAQCNNIRVLRSDRNPFSCSRARGGTACVQPADKFGIISLSNSFFDGILTGSNFNIA